MENSKQILWAKAGAAGATVLCWASGAVASTSSGMPWDSPIQTLVKGMSGPVAFGFAMIGLIVLGVRWIYGGELGAAAKTLMTMVIGISILVGAAGVLSTLFGVSSAMIAQ
jgi:type IV secretion system protein TrbC